MHPELEKMLQLEFFKREGFERRKCKKCGSFFWTRGNEELCGDAPCVSYSFIGNPIGRKNDLHSMRKKFLSFFEENGHEIIARYPVVARWRDDIYLTIASIANFQPHVTSGISKPPANPLVISQPSIRLNDLEEVGKSGRHLTLFEMMGHHAFNNHEKIYWTEETVEYCNNFMREVGIEEVIYKEGEWAGGGNAGACLEVLCGGLEVATLVFMNLREDEKGEFLIKGARYSKMPIRVVDTGYGLERLVWLTNGSKTVYDAIFKYAVDRIDSEAKIKSKEEVYAIADHARCIAFMLADGIVPSNSGAGYLARLIIRRALRFMKKIGFEGLFDVVSLHIDEMGRDFPELKNSRSRIKEIIEIEEDKFNSIIERGKAILSRYKKVGVEELVELYDSHGIHPEIVKEIIDVEIPEKFESMIVERHLKSREEKKEERTYPYNTSKIYYEMPYEKEFNAKVIYKGENFVILDKTLFYPEGGGEKSDTGYLIQNGKKARVIKAEKAGDAILHYIDGEIGEGEVKGIIDWERRYAMMIHHTATHIINHASRITLGEHVWQAGSELDENEARLDITHYKRISVEEAREIEKRANEVVRKGIEVKKYFYERNEAEKKYGMRLYQGGAPKSSVIRVVEIPGIEAEACGGMHIDNTREAGLIKIIGIERVQDGVERIRFCAGERAIEYIQKQEEIIRKLAEGLNLQQDKIVSAVEEMEKEIKELRKELRKLKEKISEENAEFYEGIKIINQNELVPSSIKELTKEKAVVVSASIKEENAIITLACSPDISLDCSKIVKTLSQKGGGKRTIAQASIEKDRAEEFKKDAIRIIKEEIKKFKMK
ncbi:MAG: alanine--tRNA ligase [Thermoplasmatales archaeon]|nr:alanine--tRNA ligase [Thermoplasmatales archaeon]